MIVKELLDLADLGDVGKAAGLEVTLGVKDNQQPAICGQILAGEIDRLSLEADLVQKRGESLIDILAVIDRNAGHGGGGLRHRQEC